MIDDFRPIKRPAKSLPAAQGAQPREAPKTQRPGFRTPQEIAVREAFRASADTTGKSTYPLSIYAQPESPIAATPKKHGRLHQLALKWPPGKKEWLVAAVVLILAGGGISAILLNQEQPQAAIKKPVASKPKLPPKPTTVASTLSGLPVDPSINGRPVTGVMIENSLDARPQSGLGQAGVVFEAIAEGGITRFLALYQDTAPESIGPIRSARPYYVQWLMGFDASYAHVGGSPEALALVRNLGVRDLDQFANSAYYQRIGSRAAPHNVYTSINKLHQLQAAKGFGGSNFTGFPRKKAAPVKLPTARTIDLKLSGPLYNVHYDYNPGTNSYNRSQGGAGHIDVNTNASISPAVVVALDIPFGRHADGQHSEYQVIGSGPVYIFQDGAVATGTWTKSSEKSQLVLADAAGKPLLLNPGQTWITAITGAAAVSYAP